MTMERKGQYFVVKPFALIMTIIVMLLLFFFLQSFKYSTTKDTLTLDSIADTKNVLSILANSQDCIAYKPVEPGLYGSIVDVEKLDDFQKRFKYVEPECARNYMTGWHAEVKDLMTGDSWVFGVPIYSKATASRVLDWKKGSSIPIAIRHNATTVNPGKIQVEMYSGDLERLAGFIDHVCMAGKRSNSKLTEGRTFNIDYPITVTDKKMCLVLGKDKICRDLYCDTVFEGVSVAGEYKLTATYMYAADKVVVSI